MSERVGQALVAEGLARQGRVAEAVRACYEALAIDERDPATHALLANLMLEEDFYDEAIDAATQAIEIDPDCAPAYLALGLAYDRRGGMWDQSVLVWHELAEVRPDLVMAHVQLGEAFSAAAFDEEAEESWQRALEIDPKAARAHYNLAIASLKKEGVATALPRFRTAGALDPSQDELFFALVDEARGVADDADGLAMASGGPADHGDDRAARLQEARRLMVQDDLLGGGELVRSVIDEDPHASEALTLAAYIYLKQEAHVEAMACALKALQIDTTSTAALYTLGVVYSRTQGLALHTARVFLALAKAAPRHALVHVLLGEALLQLQRYAQAKQAYRTAVRLDPACVRARFGLAAVRFTEGSYAEAQWQIRRAAYYDTRRQGLFWGLFDDYLRGGGA